MPPDAGLVLEAGERVFIVEFYGAITGEAEAVGADRVTGMAGHVRAHVFHVEHFMFTGMLVAIGQSDRRMMEQR